MGNNLAMKLCPCGFLRGLAQPLQLQSGPDPTLREQNFRAPPRPDRHASRGPGRPDRGDARNPYRRTIGCDQGAVDRAREIQKTRFTGNNRIYFNSQMGPKEIERHCLLDPPGLALLEKGSRNSASRPGLSPHSQIARTIADMEGAERILSANIAEAIQYRRFDRKSSGS